MGIIFFPAYDWAISPTHPERQERLLYTQDQLREEGIFDIENIREYKAEVAAIKDIQRVHFCFPDVERVVTESHLIAAGGTIKSGILVVENQADKSFALIRPPGHHAMKVVHGNRGFCNINNEAIMIEYLRSNYDIKKVAIVDTDCHHGDGTQDIYWNDPNVLYISIHQDGRTLYPGSGFPQELGGINALGKTLNIPLPPGTGDEGFLYVLEEVILPVLADFKPELIINSAGQDNHYSDPITNMNFSAGGYARLNDQLNPDICVLEGGYSIQGALPYVNLGIILAMAGLDYSFVREPDFEPERVRQSSETTRAIKEISRLVLNLYRNPPVDLYPNRVVGHYARREKHIYYDTDRIMDRQIEWVRICDDCPGLLQIETVSTVNPLSKAIEIPLHACEACIDAGYAAMEEAKKDKKYRFLNIIDRPREVFEILKH
ncbi:MAG: histone deacetylase [Calditrichia bacterium]